MKVFLLITSVLMLLPGCTTVYDLGGGRYARVALSEERSPFGTNGAFIQLQNCKGEKQHPNDMNLSYSDCRPMSEWTPISSQGQGGLIVSGAFIGAGAGIAGALISPHAPIAGPAMTIITPKGGHQ